MSAALERRAFLKLLLPAGLATLWSELAPAAASPAESSAAGRQKPDRKFVVGHRGACAYAPENTLESYRLAIQQRADYVEQDLQITKDGVLVCCHDTSLERISNVRDVFPDRFKEETVKGQKIKRWYFHEFTLKEIKQLDAGAWFDPKFKGVTIPTWQEAIDTIKGKAGLCPETKGPEFYGRLGFDMEALVTEALKKNGLEKPGAIPATPVLLQSFSLASLKKLRTQHGLRLPMLQLAAAGAKWTPETLAEIKTYADAFGPDKKDATPALVQAAHAAGLQVVAYTFRARDVKEFKDVSEEMRHYLNAIGLDGMFTDNPDKFPREK
ncbi:MAG TPA: glycerophosphodiester phosphodiesterase family protein [Methylomirabilota bacterium]|nr:glycerophosphodiester phosphodiesterase family protein [Methylomirabilota bacterium]